MLSMGCYVVVDDYDFFSSGAKVAVDEFLAQHGRDYEGIRGPEFMKRFVALHKLR